MYNRYRHHHLDWDHMRWYESKRKGKYTYTLRESNIGRDKTVYIWFWHLDDTRKEFCDKHIEKDFCICYNANRQKRDYKSIWTKEWIPRPYCRTVWGFFLSFIVAKNPLGYLLPLSSLSNHLMMQWQTTPPTTVTKKEITTSIQTPPPCCGYRWATK